MDGNVKGDTEKIQSAIDSSISILSDLTGLKKTIDNEIININGQVGVGTIVDRIPNNKSDEIDTISMEHANAALQNQKAILEEYDRAETKGEGSFLGNLFGGFTQGVVGVAEGFLDTGASLIGATAGFFGYKGMESKMADFVGRDLAYEAAYAVGNKVSGGKGYDENSLAAKGGRFVGTTASYVALGYVCGTTMAADAALGAVSGFGKGMQQGVRSGKTLTESVWTYGATGAVQEALYSMASNYIFSKAAKGISKLKNSRKVASEGAETAAKAGASEGAETAVKAGASEGAEKTVKAGASEGAEKTVKAGASESAEKTVKAGANEGAEAAANNADEVLKSKTPKTETPKTETPKTETPKVETPKVETPKAETPKAETPSTHSGGNSEKPIVGGDTPESGVQLRQSDEVLKSETPKTETPKTETPKTETPKTETPKTEKPKTETPKVETPSTHSGGNSEKPIVGGDAPESGVQLRQSDEVFKSETPRNTSNPTFDTNFEDAAIPETQTINPNPTPEAEVSPTVNGRETIPKKGGNSSGSSSGGKNREWIAQTVDEGSVGEAKNILKAATGETSEEIAEQAGKGLGDAAATGAKETAKEAGEETAKKGLGTKLKNALTTDAALSSNGRVLSHLTPYRGLKSVTSVFKPNSGINQGQNSSDGNYPAYDDTSTSNPTGDTPTGDNGNYNYDSPTYPSNTGTTSGGGGYYGPTSSNPVNYDDSSDQFRSNGDTTDNKTDDTNKNTNKTTDDASKTDTSTKPSKDTTTITPATSSPATSGPTTSITTPPSNTGNEATTGSTNTIHTGGGYTGSGGYTSGQQNTTGDMTDGIIDGAVDGTTGTDSSITGALTEGTTSIEDVIKGSKVTKIPTSPSPVTTTSSSSGSSAVIPIAAGLSAAAAAGIGAKAYMDRKHNNDNGEDDEDEFDTDEWSGDDSVDIQYDEDTANGENYLDDDDDYSYQATSNNEEKYDARSSEELADLQ